MRNEIRTRLAALQALEAKTMAAERRILEQAETRLEEVRNRLDELRPRVMLDDDASDEYRSLILERGRLHLVIARARRVVEPSAHR